MAGGLMELTFKGNQDLYLIGNPQISFFKSIYKTHTNFAIESKRLDLNKTTLNFINTTKFICKIKRHGDLVSQMYLCVTLPNIYSDNLLKFKWVENIGQALINSIEIYIGGSLIDKQYGEWMHIWNELTISKSKRELYDKMIGNTLDMIDPTSYNGGIYPANSIGGDASIKGRQLIIPLNFWFNNNIGLALPLISIQYQEVELYIELKGLNDLYLLYEGSDYVKPDINDVTHLFKNFVDTSEVLLTDSTIEIDPYLEANYIFLDNIEREEFAKKSIDYLIEQVVRIDMNYIKDEYNTLNLALHNPVKELVWVFKRTDNELFNNWFNFTDKDLSMEIIKKCKLILNGLDRIEEKNGSYFSLVQPYQHHGQTKDGIYMYSFALKPSIFQPSGSCNMSKVNKIQLYLDLNTPLNNSYEYNLSLYSISYNFLRVMSGSANVAFHL
jgi:hypothetical protein